VPRLARSRGRGLRLRRDRGTIAALVGILLAGNVALGMAALVVDVGLLYAEQEQLQAGADAAAVRVAKLCAADNDGCDAHASEKAVEYAGLNASDGKARAEVCGRVLEAGTGSPNRLSPCDDASSLGTLARCAGEAPPDPEPYVEVRTRTLRPDGEQVLPPAFAGAVTGTDGVTVAACSRVGWGPVLSQRLDIALAMSITEFNDATKNGTRFQPAPPNSSGHDPDLEDGFAQTTFRWCKPSDCVTSSGTRGFGFLVAGSSCRLTVTVGAWYRGTVSAGTPTGCGSRIRIAHDRYRPVAVAIFDDADDAAHPNRFRVAGIAMFEITGIQRLGGWPAPPPNRLPKPAPATLCTGGGSTPRTLCLYGYFTTRVFRTGTGDLGDDHFGAVYIRTIG
jgi:hypothetical protein